MRCSEARTTNNSKICLRAMPYMSHRPAKPEDIPADPPTSHRCRLYVGGLAPKVEAEDLAACFKSFGSVIGVDVPAVKSHQVPVDVRSGAANRGFAFVEIEAHSDKSLRQCVSVVSVRLNSNQALLPLSHYLDTGLIHRWWILHSWIAHFRISRECF